VEVNTIEVDGKEVDVLKIYNSTVTPYGAQATKQSYSIEFLAFKSVNKKLWRLALHG